MPARPSALLAWLAGLPPLAVGIGVSVAAHGLVLSLHFTLPDATRFMRDKAFDIVLVNARSKQRPVDPQVLAQSNLDGGGDTVEDRRAKTPLPPSQQQVTGDDLLELRKKQVRDLEARQQQLVAQTRSVRATSSTSGGENNSEPQKLTGLDLAESAKAMARQQSVVDKSLEEYNKRPRKQSIGVRAVEYRFARYIEDWRAKVERMGTLNYPEEARGKLYGALVVTVQITADGVVKNIEINRSSGHKVLDQAARRIIMMGSPYAAFPPEVRRDTDILEFTRKWSFTQGDTVETQ